MKKLLTLLSFAACLATAQPYTYSFTEAPGAVSCSHVQPYQQWYSNLVENSTPPYPNALQPYDHVMLAAPNHPYPLPSCSYFGGFVSANGYTANLQLGNGIGLLRISSGTAVEINNVVWTSPSTYPAEGESVVFSLTADIINVCNAICVPASGSLHMSGHYHFSWQQHVVYRWNYVLKVWTDDDAEIDGQSTVAILD